MNNKSKTAKQQIINSKDCTTISRCAFDEFIHSDEAQTRIGVSIAEEAAKNESARRRIHAPLTIEERMFHVKHS